MESLDTGAGMSSRDVFSPDSRLEDPAGWLFRILSGLLCMIAIAGILAWVLGLVDDTGWSVLEALIFLPLCLVMAWITGTIAVTNVLPPTLLGPSQKGSGRPREKRMSARFLAKAQALDPLVLEYQLEMFFRGMGAGIVEADILCNDTVCMSISESGASALYITIPHSFDRELDDLVEEGLLVLPAEPEWLDYRRCSASAPGAINLAVERACKTSIHLLVRSVIYKLNGFRPDDRFEIRRLR